MIGIVILSPAQGSARAEIALTKEKIPYPRRSTEKVMKKAQLGLAAFEIEEVRCFLTKIPN